MNGNASDVVAHGSVANTTIEVDLTTVCRLTTGHDWHGASIWRWLLFFALWPPLGLLGHILAWIISTTVITFEGTVCPRPH